MPQVMASTSRAYLRSSTAMVATASQHPLRRRWRDQALASTVAAILGTGMLALPGVSFAQAQDLFLPLPYDYYDISASGDHVIGNLFGVEGSEIYLGQYNLTVNQTNPNAFRGTISGTGGLIKNGAGHLTLTGENTYTGVTTVNAGILQIGAGNTGSIVGDIVNNADIYFQRDNGLTYSGVISGNGGIMNIGAGTLTLTGVNTYTGRTRVSSGTIAIGAGGSISNTSRVDLGNAGTKFDISGSSANQTIGGLIGVAGSEVILGSRRLTINGSANGEFSGVISGSGGIVKSGTGTLMLRGSNTFTGSISLSGGTLAISGGGSLNGNRIDVGGVSTLDITGAAPQTIGMLTGSASGRVVLGASNLTVTGVDQSTGYFRGTVSGTGTLIKAGTGVLAFSAANAVSGGIEIAGGGVTIVEDGTLTSSSSIFLSGAGTLFDISAANNNQTIGGLSGVAGSQVVLGSKSLTTNGSGNFGGAILGTGDLIKNGDGVLSLTGQNTYTGNTVINGGALYLAGGASISSSSAVVLNSDFARFDIGNSGQAKTIGGLTGVAGSVVNIGFNTLNIAQALDGTFGGNIFGIGVVNKQGSGVLTLTGRNALEGDILIMGGTLAIAGNGSVSDSRLIYLGMPGSVFDISAANSHQSINWLESNSVSEVRLGANNLTVNIDGPGVVATHSGTISGTGSFTKAGNATMHFNGTNTYTGLTTIADGTLALHNFGSIAASSGVSLTNTGARFDISHLFAGTTIGSLSGVEGTEVILDGNYLTINQTTNATFNGVISGYGGVAKSGSGTLTLLGNNAYVGNTLINAGALVVGNGGTTGSLVGNITNNGALTFSRSDNYNYNSFIDGTGFLTKEGAGTLTLQGMHTYSGQTLIANGTLALAGGANLRGSYLINLSNAGSALDISTAVGSATIGALAGVAGSEVKLGSKTLYIDQRTDQNFAGSITGIGSIAKIGNETLYLTGDNTYSGGTEISGGTLSIGNGGTTGSIVGDITNNYSLTFNRSDDFTYSGNISGNGFLTKEGAGTLTLTGLHNFYGPTIIRDGKLEFVSNLVSGPRDIGTIDVASGAALGFSGTGTASVGGDIILQNDATLSIHAGGPAVALMTNGLHLGQNTTFNLSGISDEARLPLTLVSTLGGITGDFASVTVGGFAGSVDYMTVHTGKSADGLSYTANYGLSWTADNNLAHGTFTLTDATNSFTLGTALSDRAANAANGWNGTSLTKAGAGTLILTGDNTYTGGTTISGGTLQLGDGSTTGSVLGAIANDGVLAINRMDSVTLANTVSGSGQLEQRGTGTVIVTGNNSYSGGTRVLGGTLSVSDNANLGAVNGEIELNGGVLQITGTTFGTLDRNVALGINGGTFDIANAANSLTVSSDIIGGGNLTKRGDGALTLAGNAALGGVRVESGILNATLPSIAGNIALTGANSRLNLTDTGSTYSGVISGNGELSIDSGGITTLTGDNSGFLGLTRLQGGILLVGTPQAAVRLGGSLDVASGAMLGGSGTFGSGAGSVITIDDGATLSPGNSIGTLTIDGDLVLAGGSILNVELGTAGSALGSASTNDRVDVTGNLTLGGTLNLSQSAASSDGAAGYGYYRLATYGGSLINNGLDIGTTPTINGADFQILTTSAGAVDLFIASIGDQSLQHWQGGDGVWNGTNAQWLNRDGQLAATWGGNTAVFRNAQGGTITVEGAVLFEGLQFVDDGFSLIGSGLLEMGSDGAEIRVLANSANIATSIIGAGGITKTQAGTLNLSGYNVYDGGTTITGGTVSVSRDENLGAASGGVTLNGGTLQVTGTDFGTLSRGISIGANGGAIDVADAAHTLTVTSAITGGNLIKRGAGTLALTGSNAYGNTSIEQGAMTGTLSHFGGDISVSAGAALNLNQTTGTTFNGAFSGQGTININGDGYTLLTWDSSAFTGTTNLNGGTLLIGNEQSAGRLGGSLNVASGATLGGSGIIGSGTGSLVTIRSGATLSPGNSIGTLMVNGSLKFEDGARYVVEVNPLGLNSDKLIVTGTATLNGGTVAHIGATGNYNPRSTYTILDAGTLTGAFGSVTSDFAFLNPKLVYDYAAGTVDLELVRNDRDFASLAQTRNQSATANAIDSIGYTAGHAVYDAVVQLADDANEIRRSFDQLSGELHGSVRSTLIEDSRFVRTAANDRLRAAFGQSAGDQAPVLAYATNGDQIAVDATYEGTAFWAQAYGSWGSFDADTASIELDRQITGALIGGDVSLNNWRVGAIAGYGQSEIQTDGQKAVADSRTLGVYAGSQWGKASLRLAMTQSWHDIDTHRSVQITGFTDYVEGEYSATTDQAFAEIGYELISRDRSQLQAFANVAQVRARTDAFGETGGAASLDVAKADSDATFTTLGLRGSRQIELGETAAMLRGSAGWRSASGDLSAEGLHAFSAGDAFAVAGAPIAKDAAVIETGVDVRFNATTTFGLTYTGQISDRTQDHGFNARLNIRF